MRRTLVLAAAVLALAGCSSGPGTPDTAPGTQNTVGTTTSPPSATCNLKSKADILVRYVTPLGPATAQELGSVNLALCEPTFDTLADTTSTDAGYCTSTAWMSDNVGYNVDAVPAPPLKKIQAQAGQACG